MASGSRSVPSAAPVWPVEADPGRVRKALLMALWSPSIILTGVIHVLCRPLTKRVLASVVILDIPLQWGTHLGMLSGSAEALGALNGFDFSITTIALAGLYVGWLFSEGTQRRSLPIVWNWPIATYTAAVVASLLVSTHLQLSLFQVYLMLELLLLYLYFAANVTSREDIAFILRFILIGGVIESAYILVLAAAGHDFALVRMLGFKTVVYLPVLPGETIRFGGTIGSPNYAAFYLATLIILALAARRMSLAPRIRRLTIPVLILAVPALLVTLSRGGWLELILGAGIFFGAIWVRKGFSRGRMLTLVLVLVLAALCLYLPNPVSRRLTGSDNGSAYSRIPLMQLAGHIIAAHPVLGVGANNFAAVMRNYEGPEFRHAWLYTVHNQYLLVWSETGLIGLVAYLWIFGSVIRRGWRLWMARDALFAPLGLGVAAALCGLLVHMSVEMFPGGALVQLVWIFTAMLGACELIQRSEAADQLKLREAQSEPQTA